MTAAATWVRGARPRTLGAAVVPVIVGTAAAGTATWPRALGCLGVALGMQVGVNYANDYFDGVRGVDTAERVGPVRLVASGLASARAVLTAALLSFAVAAACGAALALVVDVRLFAVGAAALLAALAYSGGPRPYASLGLGEAFVFVFFGLVAVAGTAYVNAEAIATESWWCAVAIGLLAVAILMANNLRDIPTDAAAGKRTLAVRLGDARARTAYRLVVIAALLMPVAGVAVGHLPPATLLALTAVPMAAGPFLAVRDARGPDLVRLLQSTAILQIQFGGVLAVALWLS